MKQVNFPSYFYVFFFLINYLILWLFIWVDCIELYKYYSTIIILYYSYGAVSEGGELIHIDEHWQHIFRIMNAAGNGKFRHIKNLIKTCLSIYHRNADVERSLTNKETSLNEETLMGLPTILKKCRC